LRGKLPIGFGRSSKWQIGWRLVAFDERLAEQFAGSTIHPLPALTMRSLPTGASEPVVPSRARRRSNRNLACCVESVRPQAVALVGQAHGTRRVGNDVLVDLHVVVEPDITAAEAHRAGERVRDLLLRHVQDASEVLVHVDVE
jgi:hypothetical protein